MDLQPDEQPDGSLWSRAGALVIDTVISALLTYFIGFMVWHFNDGSLSLPGLIAVVVIMDALYFLGSWISFGGTVGMSTLGLEYLLVGPWHSKRRNQ